MGLSDAKEWAGLQRAAGATGLGKGAFSLQDYQDFIKRGSAEAGLLQRAEPSLVEFVPDLDLTHAAQRSGVSTLRSDIVAAGPGADLSYLSAPDWFATSTRWIETLRAVELKVANILSETALAAMRQSILTLILVLSATCTAGGLSLTLGLKLLNRFDRQIRTLTSELSQVAQKQFDFTPQHLEESSEIGTLSRSLEEARAALEAADRLIVHTRTAVLQTLEHNLQQLSTRDLSKQIIEDFPEDYAGLKLNYNATLNQLDEVVGQIRAVAKGIRGGSTSLFDAALDMSNRVDRQAASLEETNAALQQIASNAIETAKNVKTTKDAMDVLMEDAEFGVTQMHDASNAMSGIVKVAEEMTKVVDLIDDISFQTNLLALNAGIEAARAGEAGKGFAVVAAEVRSLAMTAGGATKDIKALITRSQASVKSGVTKVEETARIFERVKSGITKSRDEVDAIAPIAEEQSLGVQEIKGAVDELDKATQLNAGVATSNSEICASLKGEANRLTDVLDTFQTSDAGGSSETPLTSDGPSDPSNDREEPNWSKSA